jgi:hypothetical protein
MCGPALPVAIFVRLHLIEAGVLAERFIHNSIVAPGEGAESKLDGSPQGLFGCVCGTTEQAAEKGLFPKEKCEKHASGPEGHIHFMPLIPGINPRPTARRSFSAAFKARSFLLARGGAAKVAPFQSPERVLEPL